MVCQSEYLSDESHEVQGPFDSAQGDPRRCPKLFIIDILH